MGMGHLREGAWISAQARRWPFIDGHADWAKRHGNLAIIGLPDAVRNAIP